MMVSLLRDQPFALKDLSVTTVNKGKNPFIKKFRSTFPHVTYGSFAAQGYDAMVTLLRAYAAAAAPKDGPAIVKQLGLERFEGEHAPLFFCQAEQRSASHSRGQCRAEQHKAAQCRAEQYSTMQSAGSAAWSRTCSTEQRSAVRCHAVQHNPEWISVCQHKAAQCSVTSCTAAHIR